MINEYNSYFSVSKTINSENIIVPYAGSESGISGNPNPDSDPMGKNFRDLVMIGEIHGLEISASSQNSTINPNWYAIVDVYIKDTKFTSDGSEKEVLLFSGIKLKDGGRYYNEKTFVLLPTQKLCYKIKSMTSAASGQNVFNISASASVLEFKDPNAIYHKLTVNATPQDSTVLIYFYSIRSLSGYLYIPEGGKAGYTVSANHYDTITNDNVIMDTDKTFNVNLVKLKKFTLSTFTPNATITLSAPGHEHEFVQEEDSIWVRPNVTINWEVSAPHYVTQTGSFKFTSQSDPDKILTVSLELVKHTLTINPDPSDANIKFKVNGQETTGSSITVPYGSSVYYTVSKAPYTSVSSMETLLENKTLSIVLPLPENSVMFESNSPQTKVLPLRKGNYNIVMVGGGGGGSSASDLSWYVTSSGGGSGAYVYGNKTLDKNNYQIVVGAGGIGKGASGYPHPSTGGQGTPGGNSKISKWVSSSSSYTPIEQAAGGEQGIVGSAASTNRGGYGGNSNGITTLPHKNGNNGNHDQWSATGGASVYPDTSKNYGYGANSGKNNGGNGYVKITYIGPVS